MVERAFLLIQGFSHHRPPGHWMYWLAQRLRLRGERTYYPGLPFEDGPTYDEWREALRWSLLQIDDARERIVICNSLACLLWFRFSTDRRSDERPVDRLLLVVPPESSRIPEVVASFRIAGIDAKAVRASCTSPIRMVYSDDDPIYPRRGADVYAHAVGAEIDVIAGGGHLGQVEGYGPWPSLEAWCLDPAVRVEPNFPPSGLSGVLPLDAQARDE